MQKVRRRKQTFPSNFSDPSLITHRPVMSSALAGHLHHSLLTGSVVRGGGCAKRGFSIMSHANFYDLARERVRSGLAELAGKWGWYLALGVFLVILGVIASGMAVTTTILSTVL